MKKVLVLAVLAFGVLGGGAYVLLSDNTEKSNLSPKPQTTLPPSSEETVMDPSENQVSTVKYNSDGFEPKEITVTKGTKVTFINNSDIPLWVASDPHPEHTDYPEFDTPRALGRLPQQGENFSFTFDKVGTWRYHNHTASGDGTDTGVHPGTIIVK
jgi:plastocyanin